MNSLYEQFRTRTFCDIFPNFTSFHTWYDNGMFPAELTDANLSILYYALVARFGNSHIANSDENQFKINVLYTTFKYGPSWQKELGIQTSLRTLTDDQITQGSTAIYNTAMNPGDLTLGSSTIDADGNLKYINTQNTTKYKKSKLEGYSILLDLLKQDVTSIFIEKFKDLFIKILYERPLLYETEIGDDE